MNILALNPMALVSALPGNIAQGVIWGIMAVGLYMTFRLLHFSDLTVDGSFATGGAVAVMMIISGWPAPFAMACAFLAGVAAGLVTGILHTVLGIPDILSGILTQIALYSINLRILGGKANQAVSVDKYTLVVSLRNISRSLLIASVIAFLVISLLYWFFGTEIGCSIRATGCNPAMSKAQGINVGAIKVLTLALGNGFVAMAGALLAQYQGFADVNMGRGAIVIGLAAVIIGEVLGEALFGKHLNFFGRLLFVVIGGIIYYIVVGFVLWLRMPSNDLKLFTAVIVAAFLAVPYLTEKSRNSYSKAAKAAARPDTAGENSTEGTTAVKAAKAAARPDTAVENSTESTTAVKAAKDAAEAETGTGEAPSGKTKTGAENVETGENAGGSAEKGGDR